MHVASTAAAAGIKRTARGLAIDGGWAARRGNGRGNSLGGVDAAIIASASAATMDVVGGGDRWERLSNLEGRHRDCWLGVCLVERYGYLVVVEPFISCCGPARIDGNREAVAGRAKTMS